jgi:hypothetical protein
MNRSAMFTLYNDSKFGITLNLRMTQAREVARRMICNWADVVIDGLVGPDTVGRYRIETNSDPQNPVPYLSYTAIDMRSDYMTEDQASQPKDPMFSFLKRNHLNRT